MLSVLICRNFSQSNFNRPHIQMRKAKAGPWPHQMTQYFANDSVFYKEMNELDTVKIAECTQYGFTKHVDIFDWSNKKWYLSPIMKPTDLVYGCTLGVLWMFLGWALSLLWVCFGCGCFGLLWVCLGYVLDIFLVCFGCFGCFGYTLSMLWIYFRETCLVACACVSRRLYQPKMV